jgi:hypothetical protein
MRIDVNYTIFFRNSDRERVCHLKLNAPLFCFSSAPSLAFVYISSFCSLSTVLMHVELNKQLFNSRVQRIYVGWNVGVSLSGFSLYIFSPPGREGE